MAPSSNLYRASFIGPLLLLAITCQQAFQRNITAIAPWTQEKIQQRMVSWPNGSFPLFDAFWHVKPLDELWRVVVVSFTLSTFEIDPVSWWQMFSFLADAGLVYAIWVIESNRLANKRTTAYYPAIVATIFQVIGGGVLSPFYYVAFLLTAPRACSLTQSTRVLDLANVRTLLPSLLLTYYAPILGAYLTPTHYIRHWCTWVWQMFPIWIAISQQVLTLIFPAKQTPITASVSAGEMYHVRLTIRTLALMSSAIWLYTLFFSPYSFRSVFVPATFAADEPVLALRTLLQWDHVCFFTESLLWVSYLTADLKESEGRGLRVVWSALRMMALGLVVGPGATIAIEWLKREEALLKGLESRDRVKSRHAK